MYTSCDTEFGVYVQINQSGYIKAQALSTSDSLLFLNWDSLVLDRDSWLFTRWVPGLTIPFCNKIINIHAVDVLHMGLW